MLSIGLAVCNCNAQSVQEFECYLQNMLISLYTLKNTLFKFLRPKQEHTKVSEWFHFCVCVILRLKNIVLWMVINVNFRIHELYFIICVYKIQLVRVDEIEQYPYVCVSRGCELFEGRLCNILHPCPQNSICIKQGLSI